MAFLSLPLAPGGHYCGFSFSSSIFRDKDARTVFIKIFKDAHLLDHYQMMFLSENESRGLRQTSTCSYTCTEVHREENKICRNESSSNIQYKKNKRKATSQSMVGKHFIFFNIKCLILILRHI